MTSKEFVIWLKGFTEGVHEFNVTAKQWDYLKEKLAEVSDEQKIGTPIGQGGWGTPNITPIMPLPYYPNPLDNPFKVTCSSGSFTYNPSLTTYAYPSGSVWSYTNNSYVNPYKPFSSGPDKPKKKKKNWEDEIELGGSE